MNIHALYGRISPLFRRRRMRRFLTTLAPQAGERLLDIGGTALFWRETTLPVRLTLLNLASTATEFSAATQGIDSRGGALTFVAGDACALPMAEGAFDVVFSNSVIEHVGTWERQQAFAREARRVGRRLWIQTPAREFFIEPHLIAPFVHWLPRAWQRRLIRRFTLRGWVDRFTPADVESFLAEVRLLTFSEMKVLFPDCTILRERFLGMTKSYIAVRTLP